MRSLRGLLGPAAAALPGAVASTPSRRRRALAVALAPRTPHGPLHPVVETTGLKIHDEGESKMRRHGWTKRRDGATVHLGVDEAARELRDVHVTPPTVAGGRQLPAARADHSAPPAQATAGGPCIGQRCYAAVPARSGPPRGVRIESMNLPGACR